MLVKVTRKIRWGLRMVGKKPYRRIFELHVDQEIDFIDACNGAHTEKQLLPQINSYDPEFDKSAGIGRVEPRGIGLPLGTQYT